MCTVQIPSCYLCGSIPLHTYLLFLPLQCLPMFCLPST
jgi:hypothetical protein